MLAVTRFRIPPDVEPSFRGLARTASEFYLSRPGCESSEVVRNLDEPDLWALVSRWVDVGSYRRAFNGYDAKVVLTPLLLMALDEPGAYDHPEDVGRNQPRSR